MNHWHTAERMASDHRADLAREASGGIRMRAAGENRSTRDEGERQSRALVISPAPALALVARAVTVLRALVTRSSAA
jgi:hypothetical protein